MSLDQRKVEIASDLLRRVGTLCDSGFALAAHIRYTRPTFLYQNYAPKWMEYYSTKGFMLSDPVVHWGLVNTGSVEWDSLNSQDPEGVLVAAKAHGLNHGWTYSTGPATSRTISGLTRKKTAFSPKDRTEIISLIDQLHEVFDGFETFSPETLAALRALG